MKKSDFKVAADYTVLSAVPRVKQAIADFCNTYTDGDIVRFAAEYAEEHGVTIDTTADAVRVTGEAFCATTSDTVHFQVNAVLLSWWGAWSVRIYIDEFGTMTRDCGDIRAYAYNKAGSTRE